MGTTEVPSRMVLVCWKAAAKAVSASVVLGFWFVQNCFTPAASARSTRSSIARGSAHGMVRPIRSRTSPWGACSAPWSLVVSNMVVLLFVLAYNQGTLDGTRCKLSIICILFVHVFYFLLCYARCRNSGARLPVLDTDQTLSRSPGSH